MATRTAPLWIRHKERRFAHASRIWKAFEQLPVGLVVLVLCLPIGLLRYVLLAGVCIASLVVWLRLKPEERIRKYEAARGCLNVAITRYEVDPERSESTLTDAEQRASEILLR